MASSLAAQLHYTLTLVSDWFLPPSLSPIPAGRRVGIVLGWEREDAPSPVGKAEDRTQNPFNVLSRQQQRTKCVTAVLCHLRSHLLVQGQPVVTSDRQKLTLAQTVQSNAVPGVYPPLLGLPGSLSPPDLHLGSHCWRHTKLTSREGKKRMDQVLGQFTVPRHGPGNRWTSIGFAVVTDVRHPLSQRNLSTFYFLLLIYFLLKWHWK